MKHWHLYPNSESQSGSAPTVSAEQAAENVEAARRVATPHIGSSFAGPKIGGYIPPAPGLASQQQRRKR